MKTYGEIISLVRPFFLSRGGDVISNAEQILSYTNFAIQDIYNEDDATFTYVTETLDKSIIDGVSVYTSSFPMRKVQQVTDETNEFSSFTPTLYRACSDGCEYTFTETEIRMVGDNKPDKIVVTYIKDYQWAVYDVDLIKIIPLPNRYLPALIKLVYDWAGPINLMQDESANYDFFSHGMNRINKLKINDAVTDNYKP